MKKTIAIYSFLLIPFYTLYAQAFSTGQIPPFASFTAGISDCSAVLYWNPGVEASGDYFLVERGVNGTDFQVIASIPGKGNADPEYQYKDSEPVQGNNYYRIRRVNSTGYNGVTEIRPVFVRCGSAMAVYPTVTNGTVNVKLPNGYEHAKITLANPMGHQQPPGVTSTGLQRVIHLDGMPAGLYVLQIENGNHVQTFKVMKQ